MKKYFISLLLVSSAILTGCYGDQGNTDFTDAEIITVTGVAFEYQLRLEEDLKIDPVVTSNKDADWEYTWVSINSREQLVDTIARTIAIELPAYTFGNLWSIHFFAKNKLTGYTHISRVVIRIVSNYTLGWFILKDDGSYTDVDVFPISQSNFDRNPNIQPTHFNPIENALSLSNNGRKLLGRGKNVSITRSWKGFDNDYRTSVHGYIFTSENDFSMTRTLNMEEVFDMNSVTLEPIGATQAGFFTMLGGLGETGIALFDGKLYAQYVGAQMSSGRFGLPSNLSSSSNYRLSEHVFVYGSGTMTSGAIFFDESTSSFVLCGLYGTISYVNKATSASPEWTSQIEVRDNNLTCLYMGSWTGYTIAGNVCKGYGVFENKTTGKRQILVLDRSSATASGFNPLNLRIQAEIAETDKMHKATMFTMLTDDQMMYFVGEDGNVYSRYVPLAGGLSSEQLEFAVPAGETVTLIRNNRFAFPNVNDPRSQIVIATSKGEGEDATYNMRVYNKSAGRLTDLIMEFKGNGHARDFMTVYNQAATHNQIFLPFRYK